MEERSVLWIAVTALIIGIVALAVAVFYRPTPTAAGISLTPEQTLEVEIYHHDSWARPALENITGISPDVKAATLYMWRPLGLYVVEGTTVHLRVVNEAGSRVHGLEIPELGLDTGPIMPREVKPAREDRTVTLTFTPDEPGIYKFQCSIPFDPTKTPKDCSPDHKYQYGYLIVLARA